MKWIIAIVVLAAVYYWANFQFLKLDDLRANVHSALIDLSAAGNAVNEEFARNKAMPKSRDFPVTQKHVRGVKLESDGRLVATLSFPDSPEADGKHLVFEPQVTGTDLQWRCRSPDLDHKFLPVQCR